MPVHRRKGFFKDLDNNTTSFFFTNFPEDCPGTELWKVFKRFGRVKEVFVPNKLDRWGKSFGFVKFLEVSDVEELGFRLGDVWIGDRKLKVNKARFGRDDQKRVDQKAPEEKKRREVVGVTGEGVPRVLTYRDAISNVRVQNLGAGCRTLKLLPSEFRLKTLEKCFVAVLTIHREASEVANSLVMGGFRKMMVRPMGEKLVLLETDDPGVIEEA
jgi:RNA recognition motif-containing protein